MTIQEKLIELGACEPAQEWAQGKSWEEIYNACPRGDWLCWLFNETNPYDLQILTLVKGHQANTVRHLMTDKRSISAVDAAIAFGEGKITRKELDVAAKSASAAIKSAAKSAYSAAGAAHAGALADSAAVYAAGAVAANASIAEKEAAVATNRQQTADIFRKYIPIELFKINL